MREVLGNIKSQALWDSLKHRKVHSMNSQMRHRELRAWNGKMLAEIETIHLLRLGDDVVRS